MKNSGKMNRGEIHNSLNNLGLMYDNQKGMQFKQ